MENYIEHLVKGKRGTKEYMERGVAIALPFLCFIILYLLSLPLIFFVFSFVLTYYLWNRTSIEYEYLYMAGELSVDIVYHKSSRKKLFSVEKEEILEIRQWSPETLERYKREGVPVLDLAGVGENQHYFYLVQHEGKKTAYILDCPEKLLKEMRLYSRDKWL